MNVLSCLALTFGIFAGSLLEAAEPWTLDAQQQGSRDGVSKRQGQSERWPNRRPVALTVDQEVERFSALLWELEVPGSNATIPCLSPRILVGLSETYQIDYLLPAHLRALNNDLLLLNNQVQPLIKINFAF